MGQMRASSSRSALYAAFLAVLAAAGGCGSDRPPEPTEPDPGSVVVVIEAETGADLPEFAQVTATPGVGGKGTLTIPDGVLKGRQNPGRIPYSFVVDRAGTMALWLRVRWQDGCGNSVRIVLDGGPPVTVEDRTYRVWHWVSGGRCELAAGTHRLELVPAEDGIALDQILLTSDLDYYPSGILAGAKGRAEARRPATEATQGAELRPFLAAAGGYNRSGFESVLIRLGIPTARLLDSDIQDIETLSRHDLVCLSLHGVSVSRLPPVLEAYVRQGGTLILDSKASKTYCFAPVDHPDRLLELGRGPAGSYPLGEVALQTDATFLFSQVKGSRLTGGEPATCFPVPAPMNMPGAQVFGRLTRKGHPVGAALLKRSFGKGRLYLCGFPFGIAARQVAGDFDRILANIVLDAVGRRCHAVFKHMPLVCEHNQEGLLFADDFMGRIGPPGPAWVIERGDFALTGDKALIPHHAFSLSASGPGVLAAAGNPGWRDYRVAASVFTVGARAGPWLTLGSGERLALLFEGKGSRVILKRLDRPEAVPLAEQPAPRCPGWRRLSLFARDGVLQGWLDGEPLIERKLPEATMVRGGFGLVVEEGYALLDDVAVRRVESLLPGTDRAPGEEGSCFAPSPVPTANIEARDIYTRRWHLRAPREGALAVRPLLPNYVTGKLMVDGKPFAQTPGSLERALIPLDEAALPRSEVAFICPAWRDYVFSERMTDWYASQGRWHVRPRWTCSAEYRWLGVSTRTRAVLWHKPIVQPPYAVSALMGAGSLPGSTYMGQGHHKRDLNLVVAGDGKSLESGYALRIREDYRGCELWKGGRLLRSISGIGMPGHFAVHVQWFEVRAVVEPRRLRFFFEGRPIIDYAPEEPVPAGYLGLWTQDNTVSVARVTLSVSRQPQPARQLAEDD